MDDKDYKILELKIGLANMTILFNQTALQLLGPQYEAEQRRRAQAAIDKQQSGESNA